MDVIRRINADDLMSWLETKMEMSHLMLIPQGNEKTYEETLMMVLLHVERMAKDQQVLDRIQAEIDELDRK